MNKLVVFLFCFLMITGLNACKEVESPEISLSYNCIASQSQCNIDTEIGQFAVTFSGQQSQGKILTEMPFLIKVQYQGQSSDDKLRAITGHLEGKDMFMGKVPVFFKQADLGVKDSISPSISDNSLVAQTLLANCSEEVMAWRLWLSVDIINDGISKQQAFFIDFDSQRL